MHKQLWQLAAFSAACHRQMWQPATFSDARAPAAAQSRVHMDKASSYTSCMRALAVGIP